MAFVFPNSTNINKSLPCSHVMQLVMPSQLFKWKRFEADHESNRKTKIQIGKLRFRVDWGTLFFRLDAYLPKVNWPKADTPTLSVSQQLLRTYLI